LQKKLSFSGLKKSKKPPISVKNSFEATYYARHRQASKNILWRCKNHRNNHLAKRSEESLWFKKLEIFRSPTASTE
jgi:hypothetical protein